MKKHGRGQATDPTNIFKGAHTHESTLLVRQERCPLLERIQNGDIEPSFVITHHMKLNDAPNGYSMFRDKEDECIKVVLKP